MRKTTFLRTLVAGAVLFGGIGCTDLVVEPKSTVTGGNIFNDPASYESFLAKIYSGLQTTGSQGPAGNADIITNDEGFSHYIRLVWQMNELPTDEAVIGWGDDALQELNTMAWGSSNGFLTSFYYRIFFQVSMVNEFLRETTTDKLNERGVEAALQSEIQQFRAEARFLRALSYWHAIDIFGNVPLVDENFPKGATAPEQASRQAIYDFVVSELTAIRSELPAAGMAEYGRADQGALAMLLAKVYMNAEVYTGSAAWAQAMSEVQQVISSGAYQLDDNYLHPFLADNHTSPEIIFPIPQDGERTQSYGGTTFITHASVGGNMNAGDYGLDGGWWGLRIQPEIIDLFPATGDARKDDVIYTNGHTKAIGNLSDFFNGYAAPKYRNVTSSGAPGSNPGFADVDYVMFRLADAYLMYAELVLRGAGGNAGQAVTYVNALRERAYGNTSGNITQNDLTLDFVLDERARELYWEGHRRTDLIRYGRFSTQGTWSWKGGAAAGTTVADYFNLYPLPASELLANPNLSQNPGY